MINGITENLVPVVVLFCLVLGYCIKHIKKLDKVSNQYIPTILAIIGAIICCVYKGTVDIETITYGAISGLASTGFHQVFKQFVEKEVIEYDDGKEE